MSHLAAKALIWLRFCESVLSSCNVKSFTYFTCYFSCLQQLPPSQFIQLHYCRDSYPGNHTYVPRGTTYFSRVSASQCPLCNTVLLNNSMHDMATLPWLGTSASGSRWCVSTAEMWTGENHCWQHKTTAALSSTAKSTTTLFTAHPPGAEMPSSATCNGCSLEPEWNQANKSLL